MSDLGELTAHLRHAVDDIEQGLDGGGVSPAALEEFKMTIDSVRTQVLAMLSTPEAGDYDTFLRAFRLTRAEQVCQNVLGGLIDGSIDAETPGLDRLEETLRTTQDALERALTPPA